MQNGLKLLDFMTGTILKRFPISIMNAYSAFISLGFVQDTVIYEVWFSHRSVLFQEFEIKSHYYFFNENKQAQEYSTMLIHTPESF